MTLGDLQQIALQHNPTLAQARMAVRAARGQYLQARLYPNPTIGYEGADLGIEGTAGMQGATISQEIVTGGKIGLARAAVGHQVHQTEHTLQAQRQRVLNAVRAGYYEVLLARKMIEISQQLVRITTEGVTTTEKLQAAEEVSRAEVLQVYIEAEKTKLVLQDAQNQHEVAWRQLAAVLGRPEMTPLELDGNLVGDLPLLNWEDLLARLLAESPELAAARAGMHSAACEVARQRAEWIPNVEIGTGAKYDYASQGALADVSLSLPLPLFDRNQGNIVSARADWRAAESELHRVELDLRERFAAAFGQYAIARRQVETYRDSILPKANESWDLIRRGRAQGEFGQLDALTAERTVLTVNLEYLDSLRAFWAETVQLEGLMLSGGLEWGE